MTTNLSELTQDDLDSLRDDRMRNSRENTLEDAHHWHDWHPAWPYWWARKDGPPEKFP